MQFLFGCFNKQIKKKPIQFFYKLISLEERACYLNINLVVLNMFFLSKDYNYHTGFTCIYPLKHTFHAVVSTFSVFCERSTMYYACVSQMHKHDADSELLLRFIVVISILIKKKPGFTRETISAGVNKLYIFPQLFSNRLMKGVDNVQ